MFTTRKSSAPSPRAKVSFAQMLPLFARLFTLTALADGLPHYPVRFYERLWCPLVTLWSMVLDGRKQYHTVPGAFRQTDAAGRPSPDFGSCMLRFG